MLLEELFKEAPFNPNAPENRITGGFIDVFNTGGEPGELGTPVLLPITRTKTKKGPKKKPGGKEARRPKSPPRKGPASQVDARSNTKSQPARKRISLRVSAEALRTAKEELRQQTERENAERRRQEAERRQQDAERRKADAEERNRTSSDDSDDKKVKSQQNRKNKSSIAPVDKDKIKPSANDDNVDDKKQKSTQDRKAQDKKVADLEKKRQEKEEMLRRKEELARERAKQKGQSVKRTGTDDIAYDDSDDAKRKSTKDRTDIEKKLRDKWEAGKGDDADDKKTKSQQSKKDKKVVDIRSKGSDKNTDVSKEKPIKPVGNVSKTDSDKPAANEPEADDKKVRSQQDGRSKVSKILPPTTGIDPEQLHQELGKEYQNSDYKTRAKVDQEFKDVGDKAYKEKLAELEKDKTMSKTKREMEALKAQKAAEKNLLKNKMNDAIDKATDLSKAERKALKGMAAKIAARHAAGMLTGPLAPFIQVGLAAWDAYEIATYVYYMYTHPEAWEAGKLDAWTRDTFGSPDNYMSP